MFVGGSVGEITSMKESVEYLKIVSEVNPEWSDEDLVRDIAFVFLEPKGLFRLWLDALAWKYLGK